MKQLGQLTLCGAVFASIAVFAVGSAQADTYAGSYSCKDQQVKFQVVRNYTQFHRGEADPSKKKLIATQGWITTLDDGTAKTAEVEPAGSRHYARKTAQSFGGALIRDGKDNTMTIAVTNRSKTDELHVLLCAYTVDASSTTPTVKMLSTLYTGQGETLTSNGATATLKIATMSAFPKTYFALIVEPDAKSSVAYGIEATYSEEGKYSAQGKYGAQIESFLAKYPDRYPDFSMAYLRKLGEVLEREGLELPSIGGWRSTRDQIAAIRGNWKRKYAKGEKAAYDWIVGQYAHTSHAIKMHDYFVAIEGGTKTFDDVATYYDNYIKTSSTASHANGRAFDLSPFSDELLRAAKLALTEGAAEGLFKPVQAGWVDESENNHVHIQLSAP